MIVYRDLTGNEVKSFSKGDTRDLGARPTEQQLECSKRYRVGIKYIHFFKSLQDLPRIQKIDNDPKGKFIGMFNIPMRFTLAGNGIGEYVGKVEDETPIKEFAVEVRALRLAEFIDYIYDEHCDMSVQEANEMFAELAQEQTELE